MGGTRRKSPDESEHSAVEQLFEGDADPAWPPVDVPPPPPPPDPEESDA